MPATVADVCAAIGAVVVASTPDIETGTPYSLHTDGRDLRELSATAGGSDSSRICQVVPGEVVGVGSWRQGSFAVMQRFSVRGRYYCAERGRDWATKQQMAASDITRWLHNLLQPGATWGGVPIQSLQLAGSGITGKAEADSRLFFAELSVVVTYTVQGQTL